MHKDIRLVLETARKLDVPVPSAAVADGLLVRCGRGHAPAAEGARSAGDGTGRYRGY
jgi:3-hydroxyisobutyrate dehydrogenase-like beta-hydroxyacid dehydrogenase